jgi:DNA repair exonuclease SbcCD ATPase subunit
VQNEVRSLQADLVTLSQAWTASSDDSKRLAARAEAAEKEAFELSAQLAAARQHAAARDRELEAAGEELRQAAVQAERMAAHAAQLEVRGGMGFGGYAWGTRGAACGTPA